MKKQNFTYVFFTLILWGIGLFCTQANGQCLTAGFGQYPFGTTAITCTGSPQVIVSDGWAGEYSMISISSGTTYTFTSTVPTDFITIGNSSGTVALASGPTPLIWTSTVSGDVRFYTHLDAACNEIALERERAVSCAAAACPAPTAVAVNSVTMASANVTWSGSGNFIVEYGLAGFAPGTGASAGAGGTIVTSAVSPQALSGLTGNTTYDVYVRNNCSASSNGFSVNSPVVTFTTLGLPPTNDECSGAVNLTVAGICSPTSGTTVNATQSSVTPDPVCGAGGNGWDDDVWYTFTPTAGQTAVDIDFTSTGGDDDMVAQIYTSSNDNCAGTFTPFDCSDDNVGFLPGFTNITVTPGTTYFVRVFSYYSAVSSDFTICVHASGPPSPPANDECSGAINLVVTDGTCTPASGTTINATQSPVTPDPVCGEGGNGWDDDVWYTFTPATGQTSVDIDFSSTGGDNDMVAQIYTSSDGTCAGTFTPFDCSDDYLGSIPGFTYVAVTPGTTYFIRVFSYNTAVSSDFTICVHTPVPPPPTPSNDECVDAIAINAAMGAVPGTNLGANESLPPSSCNGPMAVTASDVWYAVTADATGTIEVNADETDLDVVLESYSGTCGSLTSLGCVDVPPLTIAATAGQTYYIRVDGWENTQGNFTIQVTSTPLPVAMGQLAGKLVEGNLAELAWATFSEQNNKGFNIQRSVDGKTFSDIGYVPTRALQGNSAEKLSYSFKDNVPVESLAYYRIQQMDIDGKATLSNIVHLSAKEKEQFICFAVPNPVKDLVNIKITGIQGDNPVIQVTDLSGKAIKSVTGRGAETMLNLSGLANGVYLIKYSDSEHTQTTRIVKQ